MKKLLIALVAILALTQCNPQIDNPTSGQKFSVDVAEYGLYNGVDPIYAYNIDKHQIAITKAPSYRFVMQSDDQEEYMVATVAKLPDAINLTADMDIKVVGIDGFKDGIRNMTLVRLEADRAWLWNETEQLGMVVGISLY